MIFLQQHHQACIVSYILYSMEYDRHRLCPENEVHRAPYCVNTGVVSVSLSNEKTSGCTIILLSSPRSAVSFITHEADQISQFKFFFFLNNRFFSTCGKTGEKSRGFPSIPWRWWTSLLVLRRPMRCHLPSAVVLNRQDHFHEKTHFQTLNYVPLQDLSAKPVGIELQSSNRERVDFDEGTGAISSLITKLHSVAQAWRTMQFPIRGMC